jgi:hypothetical protein
MLVLRVYFTIQLVLSLLAQDAMLEVKVKIVDFADSTAILHVQL